ncbi:MAG: hypothetical protein WBM08_13515 [Prochlorococcaceae cyanobacterium]
MVAALLAPRAPDRPLQSFRWPRLWSERRPLLERQHDRLEAQLEGMIERHSDGRVELDPAEADHEWSEGNLLLRRLSQHLRLEERWLLQADAFCVGHRASHRQAAERAIRAFRTGGHLRQARMPWLLEIKEWFDHHRLGADAIAYSRADRNGDASGGD